MFQIGMRSIFRYFPLALAITLSPIRAQEPEARQPHAKDSPAPLSELDQNTKAIEALTQKVEELTKALKAEMTQSTSELREIKRTLSHQQEGPSPTPAEAQATPAAEASPVPVLAGVAVNTRHTVQKGETLTSIAKQNGVTVDEISKANNIQDARKLQVGQELIIPTPGQTESKSQ